MQAWVARWIPLLATLVVVAGAARLGFWQLERAAEKQALQDQYRERGGAPVQPVSLQPMDAQAIRFYRVSATGEYRSGHQILIDNRIHEGRAGFHVVTPLRLAGGEMHVLVNRGWVPWRADRTSVPAIDTPEGMVEVRGRADLPARPGLVLGDGPEAADGSGVWQYLDLERYAGQVPFPIQPFVIRLDPDSGGGFVRSWPEHEDHWIARHRAYALQWFSLAVLAAATYLFLRIRRGRRKS
jgi:surfeit locus 1 family protein